ncbi:hypothetical protein MNBD_CHLOROFLEXI01-4684 [hydrothermal vent metagenome]|uniref:Uncharacterized protein n=1 Tax=hydrothermal vent metagenome TaxID=652676 RepID=A0A3B0W2K8_9ZZZZ
MDDLHSLIQEFKVFIFSLFSNLVQAGYLVAWVWLQSIVGAFIDSRHLAGLDQWTLIVFQILFAISTLIPIVTYIYKRVRKKILSAQRTVEGERNQ